MANALAPPVQNALAFDPEGSGYDHQSAMHLMELYPLTVGKPDKFVGEVVANPNAFQAWVWHPERNEYLKHSSSRDPRTGMMLKGRNHETMNKAIAADERLGYVMKKGEDGRYYSTKAHAGMHNPHSDKY